MDSEIMCDPAKLKGFRWDEFKRHFYNLTVPFRNWWGGLFGRRKAFKEGLKIAFDHAAMIAYDLGHNDVREKINEASQSVKS